MQSARRRDSEQYPNVPLDDPKAETAKNAWPRKNSCRDIISTWRPSTKTSTLVTALPPYTFFGRSCRCNAFTQCSLLYTPWLIVCQKHSRPVPEETEALR